METLAVAGMVAFGGSVILTPPVRGLAQLVGALDQPDGVRKLHARPTPLFGGLAIFGSTLLAMTMACWLGEPIRNSHLLGALSVAAVLATGAGVVDDLWALRARVKLMGQLVAAGLLVHLGLKVEQVEVVGQVISLGWLGPVLSAFWLVGCMNALNLLDGSDGLASSVGLIISLTLGIMALVAGQAEAATLAFALGGALAGFLLYNFPPAGIFLGESGSMLIGLLIGAISIQGSLKSPATVVLAAPLAALTIPILDSGAAVIRRWLTGRHIAAPDRGHIHHCLLARGLTNRQVLAAICALCVITGSTALVSLFLRSQWLAVLVTIAVVGALVATRVFGYYEYQALSDRLRRHPWRGQPILRTERMHSPLPPPHSALAAHGQGETVRGGQDASLGDGRAKT